MTRTLLLAALLTGTAWGDPCEAELPKKGAVFAGFVEYVGDGDSLCVTSSRGLIEIRLKNFWAPELHDEGGPEAKARLERIAMGKQLVCVADKRSFDRVVAECQLDGVSLAKRLRDDGAVEGGRGR